MRQEARPYDTWKVGQLVTRMLPLDVLCRCGHPGQISLAALEKKPHDMEIWRLRKRIRCTKCDRVGDITVQPSTFRRMW